MPFKADIIGMNEVYQMLHGLDNIRGYKVTNELKSVIRLSAEELKEMLVETMDRYDGTLLPSTMRFRAWRNWNTDNTPYRESGWLVECLAVQEQNGSVDADYVVEVKIPKGVKASHGADLDWVLWTIEYGDNGASQPRPIFRPVQEAVIDSGKLQRTLTKKFIDAVKSCIGR